MRIASLGSGSKGNATLVDTGETLLLIDCGLPRRDVEARLQSRGVSGQDIDAILVTHEHADHCRGVVPLAKAHDLPVFLTAGPATIAQLTDFPVMFARCRRKSRGRYHLSLIPIVETPGQLTEEAIIEAYVRAAEETIRDEPESFLWSNRRWKHQPPADQA